MKCFIIHTCITPNMQSLVTWCSFHIYMYNTMIWYSELNKDISIVVCKMFETGICWVTSISKYRWSHTTMIKTNYVFNFNSEVFFIWFSYLLYKLWFPCPEMEMSCTPNIPTCFISSAVLSLINSTFIISFKVWNKRNTFIYESLATCIC